MLSVNTNVPLIYLMILLICALQCQQPFTDNDVVILNGTDEDIEKMKEKMEVRVASRKNTKKSKTEKVGIITEPATPSSSTSTSTSTEVVTEAEVKNDNGFKEESKAGPSNAVKKEIETIPLSLPKYNPNKQARGHFGSSKRVHPTELAQDPSYKKTKKEYSVANDPQASEVYKSLFTSHKSDKSQQRAHWVTYNPFYN